MLGISSSSLCPCKFKFETLQLKKTMYNGNPYDPVSNLAAMRAQSDDPRIEEMQAALPHWMKDPAKMQPIWAELQQFEESIGMRPRKTTKQQREKKERAAADARSAKIKLEANEAFRKGDYKEAFVLYSVCCRLSGHEPLYFLNRAAAGLKLNLFAQALDDASRPIEKDFNLPKAFFRRAQAYRFLGDFGAAEADMTEALVVGKDDPTFVKEMEELKRLQALDAEGQDAWLAQQESKTVDEVFGSGEFEKFVEARLAQKD
ncbi:TPR-like protein [Hymenopellis radicata]|nr:TPR-like protein [Hymenopellis radicata]